MYVQWLAKPNAKIDKSEIIPDIEKLLDEAINSIRDISFKISPHILQNFGLAEALEAFAKKIRISNQIQIEISAIKIPRIGEITETILYRILCECINNTIKHADAQNININIDIANDYLIVFYSDDGRGFNVEERLQDKNGIGLLNMQSRLKSINGHVNFLSTPGKGTDIYIKVKIQTGLLEEND
jgi:signal transduction histidine kinase